MSGELAVCPENACMQCVKPKSLSAFYKVVTIAAPGAPETRSCL